MKKSLFILLLSSSFLAGCATPPEDPDALKAYQEANDPLEPFNRAMFNTNIALDKAILKPVAKGYRTITNPTIRKGVSNFFVNIKQPIYFTNALLQGEGTQALEISERFILNTLWGLGGLFDISQDFNIPAHSNDFGQTLAVWGWENSEPYIVWPIIGPSNPRDTIGYAGDFGLAYAETLFIEDPWTKYAMAGTDIIQKREGSIEFMDNLEQSSTDFYATVRSMSRQNRQKEINSALHKSVTTEQPADYDFDFDEMDDEAE